MNDPVEVFGNFLRERGLRFTSERREILREVFSTQEHFDVETLYESLKQKGQRASLATIYRLIPLLLEAGMIRRATHRQGHHTYEQIYGHKPHHHLICRECGKVIEFQADKIEDLLRRICREHDFQPQEKRLGVRGLCSKCRQKKR